MKQFFTLGGIAKVTIAKQMCEGSKIKITRKYVNASPFSKFAVMSSNKQSSSSLSLDLEAEHAFGAK